MTTAAQLALAKAHGEQVMPGVYIYNGEGWIDAHEVCIHNNIAPTLAAVTYIYTEVARSLAERSSDTKVRIVTKD